MSNEVFGCGDDPVAGRFLVTPTDPGATTSLCNDLRRALLSQIVGTAAVEARIDGLTHEYDVLPGVREDGVEIIANLARLRVRLNGADSAVLRLRCDDPGVVTACALNTPDGVEIVNDSQPIAVISPGGTIALSVTVRKGVGYVPPQPTEPGVISIPASFNPVHRAVCRPTDAGIEVDVVTNGVVTPRQAVVEALAVCGVSARIEETEIPERPALRLPDDLAAIFAPDTPSAVESVYLLDLPMSSYARFIERTLPEMVSGFFPVSDSQGGNTLFTTGVSLNPPAHDPEHCREHGLTYSRELVVQIRQVHRRSGERIDSEVVLCSLPVMTPDATFIVDGSSKCIVGKLGDGFTYAGPGEILAELVQPMLDRMKPVVEERLNSLVFDYTGFKDSIPRIADEITSLLPLENAIRGFFTIDARCQYTDETNPLALLTHVRRLAYQGRDELRRQGAYGIRQIHPLSYGRLDPFESPEGPNIGFIMSPASNVVADESGALRSAYRRVVDGQVTDEIVYLRADEEAETVIADALVPVDDEGRITGERIPARRGTEFDLYRTEEVGLVDASLNQCLATSSSLIPFCGRNDATRASLASNLLRQTIPPMSPEAPLVYTGEEARIARDSGAFTIARRPGTVVEAAGDRIVVRAAGESDLYRITKFRRSNQEADISQSAIVVPGQRVDAGEVIALGTGAADEGIALGRNVLVAYMPFLGCNFEDAIVASEDLVASDAFTTILHRLFAVDVGDADVWTIPEGSSVRAGDLLVQESAGRRRGLLAVPKYLDGTVRRVTRRGGTIVVTITRRAPTSIGDKFVGRHANKGVISRILSREEMPFMEDGTRVDMVLNPMGVISRMNIGQILEAHCGMAASRLGVRLRVGPYGPPDLPTVRRLLTAVGLPESGAVTLWDGRTGRPFDTPVTVGYLYMMKTAHMVDDKIYSSTTGGHTIAGHPIGWGSRPRGMRFGRMEMLALQAYGATETLQEFMTTKSSECIDRHDDAPYGECLPGTPRPHSLQSFEGLLCGLGIDVEEGWK